MKRKTLYLVGGAVFLFFGFVALVSSFTGEPPTVDGSSEFEAGVLVGYAIFPLLMFIIAGVLLWMSR